MSKHAIILTDGECADPYATQVWINDEEWAWLNRVESFGNQSSILVNLPNGLTVDGDSAVSITVGSPDNDKAQCLNSALESSEWDRDITPQDVDDDLDEDEYDQAWRDAAKALREQHDIVGVYEGLWY